MTIKSNGTVTQTTASSHANVLSAQQAPSKWASAEAEALVGGDFFSSLKNILSRGADVVSKFGPRRSNILRQTPHPYAQGAATSVIKVLGAVPSVRKFFGFELAAAVSAAKDSGRLAGRYRRYGAGYGTEWVTVGPASRALERRWTTRECARCPRRKLLPATKLSASALSPARKTQTARSRA